MLHDLQPTAQNKLPTVRLLVAKYVEDQLTEIPTYKDIIHR